VRRKAGAELEAGGLQARSALAREIDDVVIVEHRETGGRARGVEKLLEKRLRKTRQACRQQIRLSQTQHPRREPEGLAIGARVTEMAEAQQIAPRGCPADPRSFGNFRWSHLGVLVVEALDDRKPASQPGDEIVRLNVDISPVHLIACQRRHSGCAITGQSIAGGRE
jgi:hypothetical protein